MNKYDKPLMSTAHIWAKQSKCTRRQVGAVLSRDGRILVTGYNGTIKGQDNSCEYENEYGELVTSDLVLHAEQNLVAFAAKNGIATDGAEIHITLSPCKQCAKLIAQSGITRVVYDQEYKDTEGLTFLKDIGTIIEQFKKD